MGPVKIFRYFYQNEEVRFLDTTRDEYNRLQVIVATDNGIKCVPYNDIQVKKVVIGHDPYKDRMKDNNILEYQAWRKNMLEWKSFPWWKRIFIKRPLTLNRSIKIKKAE